MILSPHRRLLLKLQSYGLKNNIFCWIKDFLHGRVQRVKVGASFSSDANVLSGIPQGSILGPLLFNIYINDLPNNINSHIKIFADDTKIFNSSHNSKLLQKDINSLLEWSDIWQLKFNFAKCKVLHCGLGNENKEYFFNTDTSNVKINSCSEEKDLGVIFDDKLLFDKHINKCISKANQVLGVIKRSFESKDASLILKLYKSMVRPHLEYANNIWSPHLKRQSVSIERTQRRATKIISKLQNLPYETRLKKLSLPSLKFRRLRGDLIQAFKIFNGLDNIPINSIFKLCHNTNTRNSLFKIFVTHAYTNKKKYSFNNRVAKYWNNLSPSTKTAKNTNNFKDSLDKEKQICKLKFEYD